jgi:hypothetical protein
MAGTRLLWLATLLFLISLVLGIQEKNGGCTDPNGRPTICGGAAAGTPDSDNGGCTDPNGRPRPCS